MRPPAKVNLKGDVRGYDVRTGKLLWTFHTIPAAGEPGYETWLNGSAERGSNAGVWGRISGDAELGLVYLPVEAPLADTYGGERPGTNLYGNSLVCLDAKTGEKVWHYQLIHHDIWDWDNPTAPILMDIVVDGKPMKAVAQITKQGWVYTFDRTNGTPVWPIEERAVQAGDVPGEWYSPTQPFPTKPPAFDRQGVTEDDLIDFTPALRAEALEGMKGFRMGPIFTPPSLAAADDGTHGTIVLPSFTGGANWEGGAFDPETNVLYIGSYTQPSVAALQPGAEFLDHALHLGRRRGAAVPRRAAADQAAVGPDHRDRHEQGRAPVPDPERPDAEGNRRAPGAQGARHPADGPRDAPRLARRRRRCCSRRKAGAARPRCARTTRRPARCSRTSRCRAPWAACR